MDLWPREATDHWNDMSPFFRSENFRIFSNSIFKAYFEWNYQVYLIYFPHKTQPLIAIYKGEIARLQQFSEFPIVY